MLIPPDVSAAIPPEALIGEEAVLTDSTGIFEKAFEQSLLYYEQHYKICMIILCTGSNDNSPKIKTFKEEYTVVDLIIMSNATVTSLHLWTSAFPYRSYDAPRLDDKCDDLYEQIAYERLLKVFNKISYDYVICNFIPTKTRNIRACRRALSELKEQGKIKAYVVLPKWHTYDAMKTRMLKEAQVKGKEKTGTRFPDMQPEVMTALHERIELYLKQEQEE